MTRTGAREFAVRLVFAQSLNPRETSALLADALDPELFSSLEEEDELFLTRPRGEELDYLNRLVSGVAEHLAELDSYIEKYAVGWQFYRISRTAAAVLRVAMYELLYIPEVPPRAAVNEAIEITKKYDTPETVSFVNGVLGTFVKSEVPNGG